MPAPWNTEYYHSVRLEQPAHVFEGDRNRRRDMLKDFGRNNEIQCAFKLWRRGDNIQPRLGVVIGVCVAKLLRKWDCVTIPVGHADAANFRAIWEVWQHQALAE